MEGGYKTRQKQGVLSFFKERPNCQLTAAEIADGLKAQNIGKSTIYRQISNLCEEGKIRRFRGADGKSVVYQYTGEHRCHDHFHLKCQNCGKLIHLDCKHIDHLRQHIQLEHEFSIDMISTVIYGTCKDCREK